MGIADNKALEDSDARIKGTIFHRGFVQRVQSMLINVVHTNGPTMFEDLYTEFAPIFERAIFCSIIQTILKSHVGTLPAVSQTYYVLIKNGQISSFGARPHFFVHEEIDLTYWPANESEFYELLSKNMADTKWPMDPRQARYCYYVYVQSVRYTFVHPCSFTLINPDFGTYTVVQYSQYHNKVEHFIGPELFQMWTEEVQKQIKGV